MASGMPVMGLARTLCVVDAGTRSIAYLNDAGMEETQQKGVRGSSSSSSTTFFLPDRFGGVLRASIVGSSSFREKRLLRLNIA